MENRCLIGWKTLCEKEKLIVMEKLLVTSNFSFPHNVFHSYISLVRRNVALCGYGLIGVNLLFTRKNTSFNLSQTTNFRLKIQTERVCRRQF